MVPKVRVDHKCRLAPKNTFLALKPGFSCVHNYIFYKFKWVLQRLSTREKIMPGRVLKILGFSKISGISVSVLYHSDATSPLQVFLHIYILSLQFLRNSCVILQRRIGSHVVRLKFTPRIRSLFTKLERAG
jgi:hypothetical protein